MKQTVIFDMDGVIVDTEPIHHYAYEQHFKQLNISIDPEVYATFTGNSTKNIYEKLKSIFHLPQEVETLVETKRMLFNEAFDKNEEIYLLDGVEDLIKDLYSSGFQLLLASSSANVTINRIFDRFELHRYFSHKISGEDFVKSKPDPAIFEQAVQLSKTPKERCLVIEDSTNGIIAAKSAGLFCIGYDSINSKFQDYSRADLVISNFKEINSNSLKKI